MSRSGAGERQEQQCPHESDGARGTQRVPRAPSFSREPSVDQRVRPMSSFMTSLVPP
jgi:hypothetical protein